MVPALAGAAMISASTANATAFNNISASLRITIAGILVEVLTKGRRRNWL
jgi:hypothetical protein